MKYFLRIMLFSLFATSCIFIGFDGSWAADKDIPEKRNKGKKTSLIYGVPYDFDMKNLIILMPNTMDLLRFQGKTVMHSPWESSDLDLDIISTNLFISAGIQHSRSWDLAMDESEFYKPIFDRPHNPFDDYWEPFNTYIEIKNFLPFSIKAGRQCLGYGDRMIYGPGEWETQVGGYGML